MKNKMLLFLVGFGLFLTSARAQFTNTYYFDTPFLEQDSIYGNGDYDSFWAYFPFFGQYSFLVNDSGYNEVASGDNFIAPPGQTSITLVTPFAPQGVNLGGQTFDFPSQGSAFNIGAAGVTAHIVPEPSSFFLSLLMLAMVAVWQLRKRRIGFGKLAKGISHQLVRSLSVASRFSLWLCGCVVGWTPTGPARSGRVLAGGGGARASKHMYPTY